jgi:prepilin-type processing-associated H-X9-DG protein/prepilin-type N-terminal cleavage/methylation domain-containing protein
MNCATRREAAFSLLELLVVMAIIGALFGLMIPAVQKAREAAARTTCQNNLRQIGLGLHQYQAAFRKFPPAMETSRPYRFMSWQTRILPYVEQEQLWRQSDAAFTENPSFWTPPHAPIRSTPLSLYTCPSEGRTVGFGGLNPVPVAFTHYLGVSGDRAGDGMLYANSHVRFADIIDGSSQTLLVGERPPSSNERYGWWYAGIGQSHDGSLDSHLAARQLNQSFYAPTCPVGPYSFGPGSRTNMCDTFHFWSRHPGGANFLFCDGAVRFLGYSADSILPALATRAGGEKVVVPD